jgi:hypothetical protein
MLKVVELTQEFDPVGIARRRRPGRRLVAVMVGCLAVVGAVAGGLYWQATRASISLGYLNNRVESAIAQRLPADARVRVGSTAFSYRGGQGAILRIRELALFLPGMATVSVGELSTVTDAAALLGGRIDLHSVTISGVDIGVSGAPAALQGEGTGADLVRRMAMSFMDQVTEADILIRGAGLKEVIVRDASIHMDGEAAGIAPRLRIGEANWLPLSPNRSKAWLQIVDKNGTGWDLTLERRETQFGNTAVTLEFEDVPVAALAPALATDDGGPYFRSAVTLQTRMAKRPDGRFLGLRGILSTADGELSVTGEDKINVASTSLSFALDEAGDRLAIPSGEIRTHTGYVTFEAAADLAELGHTTIVGNIRSGALSTPIGEKKSVPIIGGGGMARVKFADLGIEIERLLLVTPDGTASAIGQASLAGPTPGVSFALSMTELPAATVRALWPSSPTRCGSGSRSTSSRERWAQRRCRSRFRQTTSARAIAAKCCPDTLWSGRCPSTTPSSPRSATSR